MIKAVIFDIDNTMYDYDGGNRIALSALKNYCTCAFSIDEKEFFVRQDKIYFSENLIIE